MVSRGKLYEQLDSLEQELYQKLIPHLKLAANGGNDIIFSTSDFNSSQHKEQHDVTTMQLIHVGRQILSLKKKLGETTEGIIAERLCWYCREWGNPESKLRGNAQELAKQFLDEITV